MTNKVTFFPEWRSNPYLDELASALADQGWRCDMVGRRGLIGALIRAAFGRETVHIHWFEGFSPGRRMIDGFVVWMYVPLLWLAGRRGRLIWTVHNLRPHEGYAPFAGEAFLNALAKCSSRLLVHRERTRLEVEERFGVAGKVFVTEHASFGHGHGPPIDRDQARAKIDSGLAPDATLFVQIGQLRSYKQPWATIESFRLSAPDSARLLIAGACDDAALRAGLIHAAGGDPRIDLRFGRLSDEMLVAALCAADWIICPYVAVDYPGAANLAIAYGCPLVAPALPAVRELSIGHPAVLYPIDGPADLRLADAIAAAAAVESGQECVSGERLPETSWAEQALRTATQYLAALAPSH